MTTWEITFESDEILQADINAGIDIAIIEALGHPIDRTAIFINIAQRDTQGLIAGLFGKALQDNSWFHINLLYVRLDHRGRGLGLELIQQCAQQARDKGFEGLTVQTMAFQAPKFYTKARFEQYAALENDFAGHTRYYFKKPL